MRVLKRTGEYEDVSFDKVLNRIRVLSNGLNVDIYDVGQKVCSRIYDGVKTSELDELAAHICSSMIIDNPDYGVLAARLTISNHHKNTSPSFSETINTLYNNKVNSEPSSLISDKLYDITMKNKEKLNSYINYERDYTFDYFGFKTLERSYLIKVDGKIVERPQQMFMRVALGIHSDDLKEALQTYDHMSRKFFTHATPTLFNSGTITPQLSSCYLIGIEDSLDGIFECVKDCARISKYAGGIGLHVANIRAKGSRIRTTNGTSDGLVPMLKVFNHTGRYINQCFTPETLVFTSSGVIEIQSVKEGDEVVTLDHESKSAIMKTVLGISKQTINKQILEIKTSIGTAPVRVTKEHELYVRRGINDDAYIPASDLNVGDSMGYPEKEGMFWFQVVSIDEIPYEGDVYDLNIEDNHNYTVVNLGLVHNSGKRNGSIAIYLEPWHADIEAFLDLKKNHGNEEDRARDLFYAIWVPDLFMERVKANSTWSLMCPDQSPGLADVYGDDFNSLYEKYEREGRYVRQVNAQDIWFRILETQIETGVPYVGFKDAANRKSNQQNLGTIKSSNLCVAGDTLLLTSKGDIPIKTLEDQVVDIWNGEEFSTVTVRKTGKDKELIAITFSNGKNIRCTPYHKFYINNGEQVEAMNLQPGNKIVPYKLPSSDETCYVTVSSVDDIDEIEDVYCFNEPKKHMGVFNGILAGNCMEIVEYSDANECSVCNLASICLPTYVNTAEDGTKSFDFDKLHEVVMLAAKNLNKIIDINFYPLEKARRSNLKHRPIGIGIQGLADTYILMGHPFDSPGAALLNKDIFETIYHAAVEASVAIAKKRHDAVEELRTLQAEAEQTRSHATRIEEIQHYLNLNEYENISGQYPGAYSTFEGSPASKGQLQFDLWGSKPHSDRYDWPALKAELAKYGLRNSLLVAPMPTASTSQIMGFTESFECITSNLYKRKTLAGEFVVVNRYLIDDLQRLGMWNKEMKNTIMLGEGSVQNIKEIPDSVRNLYKTAWEISQKTIIDQAADRGIYVCQSQSMNMFVAEPDFQNLTSMLFYSWQKGLKTGSYYIRSKPTAKVQQFTIDPKVQAKMSPARKKVPPKECVPDEEGVCHVCSA
jgi:ribonucleotide reductase alpha subunit